MEEQDRGFSGLPGGGRPDRDGGEAHRPDQARRIEAGQGVNDELLDTIQMIANIMNGMQEDFAYDR